MLKNLYIKNLKCFDEISLPLSPLTLLTGFNAAGKSTSIQSLLLISQALRSSKNISEIPLNGDLIQLGSPGSVLNENATDSQIVIQLDNSDYCLQWKLNADAKLNRLALKINEVNVVDHKNNTQSFKDNSFIIQNSDEAISNSLQSIQNTIYLSVMRKSICEVYPSPFVDSTAHANVGVEGEYAAWWFDKFDDYEIDEDRLHETEKANSLRRQLNAWFREIFPNSEAHTNSITGTSLTQMMFRSNSTSEWSSPSNIGYGLSYAFPILVAGLLAKKGQILIIDSPEAHIHPHGQSLMGKFLATVAASGVQVILETHSDHILNGVRLSVYKNTISSNDVSIHFFNPTDTSGSRVTSPLVNTKGALSEWPDGFFDQTEKDLSTLAGWD